MTNAEKVDEVAGTIEDMSETQLVAALTGYLMLETNDHIAYLRGHSTEATYDNWRRPKAIPDFITGPSKPFGIPETGE